MAPRAATEGRPYRAGSAATSVGGRPDRAGGVATSVRGRPDRAGGVATSVGGRLAPTDLVEVVRRRVVRAAVPGLALLAVLACAGCGSSSFIEAGEQTRPAVGRVRASDALDLETVAWPPPVLVAQPPDLLAGAAVPLTVGAHEERRGVHRLTLLPEAGEPLVLEYRLGVGTPARNAGERLPVEPGEELLWRLPLDGRLEPTGLLVRERDGALRALVVVGETLGPLADELGALGLTPDFSAAALVYSETTAVMSCLIGLDHHALKVSDGRDTLWVRPGTSRLVELGELKQRPRVRLSASRETPSDAPDAPDEATTATFELLVFDVSRPQSNAEDPRCPNKSHVSWALLRAANP